MANSYFQFRQFRVNQEKSAMKVCTDSCILGAYAEFENPARILDIGTGTGLLSLMLAQKFPCKIDAVEIDVNAAQQAEENFNTSPWKDRLKLYNESIQDFKRNPRPKYDLIVSNPPFFNNHLKSPDANRNRALHTGDLPFEELAEAAAGLLSSDGLFFNLLPTYESELFDKIVLSHCLFCVKKLKIFNLEGRPIFRVITAYSFLKGELQEGDLTIKDQRGNYSPEFKNLLKEYYLSL